MTAYIPIAEAHQLLNGNKEAKGKVEAIVNAHAGYSLIQPNNHEYNCAPTAPCSCNEHGRYIGIALHPSRELVLLFCTMCNGTVTRPLNAYPFVFIKEGCDEPSAQPKNPMVVVLG